MIGKTLDKQINILDILEIVGVPCMCQYAGFLEHLVY